MLVLLFCCIVVTVASTTVADAVGIDSFNNSLALLLLDGSMSV